MNIEMGESLMYSWLRHEKRCQIVQLNWKSSPKWDIENLYADELQQMMDRSKKLFKDKYGENVFGNTTSVAQLLKQAESDAVGMRSICGDEELYLADVAFHEGGLNYGSSKGTATKVAAKMIRAAMCAKKYFSNDTAHIVFASPKVNKSVNVLLEPYVEAVQQLMNGMGYHYSFELIINDDFRSSIYIPVKNISEDVADDAELFLRSYKLIHMFD